MIWAILWLVSLVALIVALVANPEHKVSGWLAFVIVGTDVVSGIAMSVHAL